MHHSGKTINPRMIGRSAAALVGLVLFGLALASCGYVRTAYHYSREKLGADINVKVDVSDTANQNSPIAVDIVMVFDDKLLEAMKKMTARQWFEKRDQIQRDYVAGTGFHAWSWEWVPGQIVPELELPWNHKAVCAIVFADYITPGDHRVIVDPFSSIHIQLGEKGFTAKNIDE